MTALENLLDRIQKEFGRAEAIASDVTDAHYKYTHESSLMSVYVDDEVERLDYILSGIQVMIDALFDKMSMHHMFSSFQQRCETLNENGIANGSWNPQFDFWQCPALEYFDWVIKSLDSLLSTTKFKSKSSKSVWDRSYDLQNLKRILRSTGKILEAEGVVPKNEMDIQRVMHKYLDIIFVGYKKNVTIYGEVGSFVTDGGVRSLQTGIEYKYGKSKAGVLRALRGIAEDCNGYSGSKDWIRFIAVIYQTKNFLTESDVQAELGRLEIENWIPLVIVGN